MLRKLIARILKLETRETLCIMAEELTQAIQNELKEKQNEVSNLKAVIELIKENESRLKKKILLFEDCIISENGSCAKDILIEDLRSKIALLEQKKDAGDFIEEEQKNKQIQTKEDFEKHRNKENNQKDQKNRIFYGSKEYDKYQEKHERHPGHITHFPPIKASETVYFTKNEKSIIGYHLDPKIKLIIEKLAKIKINVKYTEGQFFLINKNGSVSPLNERFTSLDIFEDFALLLTSTKSEFAAYSLYSGILIGNPSKEKNIILGYIQNYISSEEYKLYH